jgi:hypothetical protein
MQRGIRRAGSRVWRAQWPLVCEVAFCAALDLLYEVLRPLIAPDPAGVRAAFRHAHDIASVERALGLDIEAWAQRVTRSLAGGQFVVTWYYTLAYLSLMFVFLFAVWIWWRGNYAFIRNWFWASHLLALMVFWAYPVAPPRLANSGLIDTTKHALTLGGAFDWFQNLRNEYAAMPSLHIGLSFLYALALVWLCTAWGRWRQLWWILPIWMAWVTMATANHYLFDGLAGIATILAALGIVHLISAADIPRPWRSAHEPKRTDTLVTVRPGAGGSA